jgi:hypothetical protein
MYNPHNTKERILSNILLGVIIAAAAGILHLIGLI